MHARVCLKKVCSPWYTIIIPPAPSVVVVVPISQRALSNSFDDAKVGIKKSTDKERLCMRHTLRLMRLYLRQMRSLCAFLFLRKRVFR